MAQVKWARRRVTGDKMERVAHDDSSGQFKAFGFFSEWNEEPLKDFNQRNNSTLFKPLKDCFSCYVKNRL